MIIRVFGFGLAERIEQPNGILCSAVDKPLKFRTKVSTKLNSSNGAATRFLLLPSCSATLSAMSAFPPSSPYLSLR